MAAYTREQLEEIAKATRPAKFRGLKLHGAIFGCCNLPKEKCIHQPGDGMNLEKADFRGCALAWANFRNCPLNNAIFEGANCTGVDFDGANVRRANFKDVTMCDAKFNVVDAFGITLTMDCHCFSHLKVNTGFWWGLLYYGFLMDPLPGPDFNPEEVKEKLSALFGAERFTTLKILYANRQMY